MKMMDFIDSYGTVGLAQIMPHGAVLQTNANVFFVQNSIGSDSSGYGNSWETPFATLDYAIGQCDGTTRDVILIDPSHTENIATAGAITADKANVSIIGLGTGTNRPTFTWTGTAATFAISAANVLVKNIRCLPGIDEVVTMFYVTAANVTLDAVDHCNDNVASYQTIQFLLTTTAANYIEVRNCRHVQTTASAAATKWIQLVAADNAFIHDNYFNVITTNATASIIISVSTAATDVEICRNVILNTAGTTVLSHILLVDSCTRSIVHDNRVFGGAAAIGAIVDVGNAGWAAENYCEITLEKSGILEPPIA